jgi:hypothetical protein
MKNFGQDGRCPGLNQVPPEYKLPFFSPKLDLLTCSGSSPSLHLIMETYPASYTFCLDCQGMDRIQKLRLLLLPLN